MTTDEIVECIAKVETNDVPTIIINGHRFTKEGDNGRARGRWQLHPDEIQTLQNRYGIRPKLNETHDDFERRLVWAFCDDHNSKMPDDEIAMYFHLGHHTVETAADWDKGYAERFQGFAADYAHP